MTSLIEFSVDEAYQKGTEDEARIELQTASAGMRKH